MDGVIVEQGTYDELVKKGQAFSCLLQEFSGAKAEEPAEDEIETSGKKKQVTLEDVKRKAEDVEKATGKGRLEGRLMKAEKRTIGSIDTDGAYFFDYSRRSHYSHSSVVVYMTYLKAGNGWVILPTIVLSGVLMQAAQVMNSYWLIWWQNELVPSAIVF